MKRILTLAFISALMFSCTSSKKVVYFQGIDEANFAHMMETYEVRIMPDDNLHITVSSSDTEAAEMFNNINMSRATNVNNETLTIMGYIVDSNGNINFPTVGEVHLAGLTKKEAIDVITDKVKVYITDAVVNIRIINFKVTVLGEVSKPGVYTIKDERITIPEALGLAGDMTIYGKRKNVLICRDLDGQKHFERIDMTTPDLFMSDFYYLQQNDVVYVEPNRARAGSSTYNQNLSIGVSVISIILTLVNILI